MLRKIICAVLALIMVCLCCTACGDDDGTVLFMAVDAAAGTLDPQIVSDTTGLILVRNCFEGLVREDENGNIIPGAAESWEHEGNTFIFHLRRDAKWHLTGNAEKELEGKLPENFDLSVTARDFEFALKRAVSPDTASPEAFLLCNIAGASAALSGQASPEEIGVRAADDYTLEVTLTSSGDDFLRVLTQPMCMPCSETFFRACTGRYGRYIKYYLSNGPYYLSRLYEDSYRINLNPDYTGDFMPTSDAVWLYVNPDRESVLTKLKNGDYSCALLSQYEYENTKLPKELSVKMIPNVLRAFVMNLDDPLTSNENVRKAISYATDRVLAAESAGMTAAESIVPACADDESIRVHPEAYDEAAALSCFSNALRELRQDSLNVEILCEEAYGDMVRQLIQQWQRILGVRLGVTLKTCTREELDAAVKKGEYQIALSSVTAQSDVPFFYFSSFAETSPYNSTDYTGAAIPGYIMRLYEAGEDYGAVYRSVEQLLLNASFCVPLWNENTCFVSSVPAEKLFIRVGSDKIYFR